MLAVLFLAAFLLTLLGNTLIVMLTSLDPGLRAPMYFFLRQLALVEICFSLDVAPRLLVTLLRPGRGLSPTTCMTQLFFFIVLVGTECILLASMAYDRYVAICRPLHYPILMRPQVCLGLAMTSWLGGLLVSMVKTTCIATLSYCGPNVLNHFFCDVSPLLNLSCTHVALTELVDFISAIVILWGCFLMTMASYVAIGRAVVCMPSITARYKAFSTCASHLVVVGIFYSVTIFIYARPKRIEDMDLNKMLSVIYTVVTPMCNPVIYCLRNKEVQVAFYKTMHWS
ncbi:Olfactory receptor 5 [Lemmus lemmus]